MRREVDTFTFPAYWASALINNDYSGLEDRDPAEAERCRATVRELAKDGWEIVSTPDDCEPRFTWHYRLYGPGADCEGGDVLDYIAIKRGR